MTEQLVDQLLALSSLLGRLHGLLGRIANHLAVARAIYGWASRPTRRLVKRNPLAGIELPPNDEKPRTRVADAEEAAALIAELDPADAVPYALAFYARLSGGRGSSASIGRTSSSMATD